MTPDQAALLRQPYRWNDLKHPEGMSFSFMQYLDDVRADFGYPMRLTSDFRTPEHNATLPGHSPRSRHLVGEAVDVAWPPTANHVWMLVEAVIAQKRAGIPVELELVHSDRDRHIHIAFLEPGQSSRIIVAAD